MNSKLILLLLKSIELRAELRLQSKIAWDQSLIQLNFIPVAYSNDEIDYQLAYMQGGGAICEDISLLLFNDNRPCGLWPLCVSVLEGTTTINSYLHYGQFVIPPLFFKNTPDKTKKTITKKCLDLVDALCRSLQLNTWQSGESFVDEVGMSEWYEQSLGLGGAVTLKHELFVNLKPEMMKVKGKFRRSYKSLISEGMRTWTVGIQKEENSKLWDSFHMLHQSVAGKSTRCIETWNLQHRAIDKGNAFLVHLHDQFGRMVGGGYFAVTRDQGVYNVGAYDRALFDKPVGHVVQYSAMEEMKSRGIIWYKIGLRNYIQEQHVSPKQVSISNFMQGFSSHLFPKYLVQHFVKTPLAKELLGVK